MDPERRWRSYRADTLHKLPWAAPGRAYQVLRAAMRQRPSRALESPQGSIGGVRLCSRRSTFLTIARLVAARSTGRNRTRRSESIAALNAAALNITRWRRSPGLRPRRIDRHAAAAVRLFPWGSSPGRSIARRRARARNSSRAGRTPAWRQRPKDHHAGIAARPLRHGSTAARSFARKRAVVPAPWPSGATFAAKRSKA